MSPLVWRLVLAAVLFVGWLGYLGWQVLTRPTMNGRPLVVSRPQVLASQLDVIAEVPDKGHEVTVTVVEVLHPTESGVIPGDQLKVAGIDTAAPRRGPEDATLPAEDWSGPGKYLLLLRRVPGEKGRYEVQPIPPSPGFMPHPIDPVVRIYPATEQALAQYRQIAKPETE
jgi:hypothetical protein